MEPQTLPEKTRRSVRLFERSAEPPGFRIQPRDLEILRHVFRHRYLRPAHLFALYGGHEGRIAGRLRLLWAPGYLGRPTAQRAPRARTEQLAYALGPAGADHLERHDPQLRALNLSERDWRETPRKIRSWTTIDHDLATASFLVALEVACARVSTPRAEVRLHYEGYGARKKHRFVTEARTIQPDAFFALEIPGLGFARHYVELDRGNVNLKSMALRYRAYLEWWKRGERSRDFAQFRVLTVCEDGEHLEALRRTAVRVSTDEGHPRAWKGFWFTTTSSYGLEEPERVLGRVFRYADGEETVSLLPNVSLPD